MRSLASPWATRWCIQRSRFGSWSHSDSVMRSPSVQPSAERLRIRGGREAGNDLARQPCTASYRSVGWRSSRFPRRPAEAGRSSPCLALAFQLVALAFQLARGPEHVPQVEAQDQDRRLQRARCAEKYCRRNPASGSEATSSPICRSIWLEVEALRNRPLSLREPRGAQAFDSRMLQAGSGTPGDWLIGALAVDRSGRAPPRDFVCVHDISWTRT